MNETLSIQSQKVHALYEITFGFILLGYNTHLGTFVPRHYFKEILRTQIQ